eukprot:11924699-Alexandrium_andersonii.AAC.1
MSASLVGSEMCIRDSSHSRRSRAADRAVWPLGRAGTAAPSGFLLGPEPCLLYTSDAADDM